MAGILVLTQLKTELTSDSHGYGYAPYLAVGNYQACADLLNLQRVDQFTVREIHYREQIMAKFDLTEIAASYGHADGTGPGRLALACFALEIDHPIGVIPQGYINPAYNVYDHVRRAFQNAGDVIYNAISSESQRPSSRGESIWGAGIIVKWQDCYQAMLL
jgi:hypothetical protein